MTLTVCSDKSSEQPENKVYNVELENCKNTIDLKLSDLIDSCYLVTLETTNESVLEDFIRYIYIAEDYIIVDNNNGIYIFGKDGRFLNKIKTGRGPDELSISHSFYYSEKDDLIYINNRLFNSDRILCYDVKSQTFKPPVKKCFTSEWNDFLIYNDSIIIGSLYILDAGTNPYALFFQDFNGNFISGIKSKRKFTTKIKQEEFLQRMLLYYGNQEIHAKYIFDDTLFTLTNTQLSPCLILKYNSSPIDPPLMEPVIGESRSYFERFENPAYLIFRNSTFEGLVPFKPGAKKADYKTVYYFMNKSNGKYAIIKSYQDDLTGMNQSIENETMIFPSVLPNNKLYFVYRANELLQNQSAVHGGSAFSDSLYAQLDKIRVNLKETDNPIILIGKYKSHLRVI